MTSIADFIKLQKVDFHNYIQLGMSYPSFVTWAGYYIPEFDDKQKRLSKEFQDDFISFARLRIKTRKTCRICLPFLWQKQRPIL